MADWYVYQHDGEPLGPLSTDAVANAVLSGTLAPGAWIAATGELRWQRAIDVPVIARLVEAPPTTPQLRACGLRLVPGVSMMEPSELAGSRAPRGPRDVRQG